MVAATLQLTNDGLIFDSWGNAYVEADVHDEHEMSKRFGSLDDLLESFDEDDKQPIRRRSDRTAVLVIDVQEEENLFERLAAQQRNSCW